MNKIKVLFAEKIEASRYIKPTRFNFNKDGKASTRDIICSHNSVAVVLYNKSKEALLFVKQFRPAVFASPLLSRAKTLAEIDFRKISLESGFTLELCAGIVDKEKSLEQIAQEEIYEECGYDVPLTKIEKIVCCRCAGITLFYAEIDDSMQIRQGQLGNHNEGEMIELVSIPIAQCKLLIFDETIERNVSMLFALVWFLKIRNKFENYSNFDKLIWNIDEKVPVTFELIQKSDQIQPVRLHYEQDGRKKAWDMLSSRNRFAIVLYDEVRKGLILIKTFHPDLNLRAKLINTENNDLGKNDVHSSYGGFMYELFSDEIDTKNECEKEASIQYIRGEILDQLKIDLPAEKIERVTTSRSHVGTRGSLLTLYFGRIDGNMPKNDPNVKLIPLEECQKLIECLEVQTTAITMLGVAWFMTIKLDSLQ